MRGGGKAGAAGRLMPGRAKRRRAYACQGANAAIAHFTASARREPAENKKKGGHIHDGSIPERYHAHHA